MNDNIPNGFSPRPKVFFFAPPTTTPPTLQTTSDDCADSVTDRGRGHGALYRDVMFSSKQNAAKRAIICVYRIKSRPRFKADETARSRLPGETFNRTDTVQNRRSWPVPIYERVVKSARHRVIIISRFCFTGRRQNVSIVSMESVNAGAR